MTATVRTLPEGLELISGKGDGKHTACLMSARSLLDGRAFTDEHPSKVLAQVGIRINDGSWWADSAERTRTLLPLAVDERLCAAKCDASPDAERDRARLVVRWALSFAAPHALESAAFAMDLAGRPDDAKALRDEATALRANPTAERAREASSVARKIADADDAAYAAYADAAAAAARKANRAAMLVRKVEVRDSLIVLFGKLLDVDRRKVA